MAVYRVEVLGRNFLAEENGVAQKRAFRASLCLEALSGKEAEEKAFLAVRENERLKEMMLNSPDDPPLLFAEKITMQEFSEGKLSVPIDFEFFTEEMAHIDLGDILKDGEE